MTVEKRKKTSFTHCKMADMMVLPNHYYTVAETVAVVPMDGTTYDIKAVPVSITGAVSTDYITDQVTVSNQAGGVYLGTNNYLAYGKTGFTDDINNGFWLGVNALNVAQFNIGDITDSLKWDGTNLSITGNINAESGTIGGW